MTHLNWHSTLLKLVNVLIISSCTLVIYLWYVVPDCVLPAIHVPVLYDSLWDLGDHHRCELSGVPALGLTCPHRATQWCYSYCSPRLLLLCHSAQHRGAYISLCQVE